MRAIFLFVIFCFIQVGCFGEGGIQWYATWQSGLNQARRTGRPILLIAAAPHCHNVSGIW